MTQVSGIFFDIGGTLFRPNAQGCEGEPSSADVQRGRFDRLAGALGAIGKAVDREKLEAQGPDIEHQVLSAGEPYTMSIDEVVRCLAQKCDISLSQNELPWLSCVYAGPRYQSWLFDGTQETLTILAQRGYSLGVIANTNGPRYVMDMALTGVGLRDLFKVCLYSCDEKVAKPDPRLFERAQDFAGLRGQSVAYVGDSASADIAPAHALGWQTAHRVPDGQVGCPDADFVFSQSKQLLEFFP